MSWVRLWSERTPLKVSFAERVKVRPIPSVGHRKSCRGGAGAKTLWRGEDRELDRPGGREEGGVKRQEECVAVQVRSHEPQSCRTHECEEAGGVLLREDGPGVNSLDVSRDVYNTGGTDFSFESGVHYARVFRDKSVIVASARMLPVRSDSCSAEHSVPAKAAMTQPAIRRVSLGNRPVPTDVNRAFLGRAREWQFESVGRRGVEPRVEGGAFSIHRLLSANPLPPRMHMYSAKQTYTDTPDLLPPGSSALKHK